MEGTFISIESIIPILDALNPLDEPYRKMPDIRYIFPGAAYGSDNELDLMDNYDFAILRIALKHKSEAFKKLGLCTPNQSMWDFIASWPCMYEDGQNWMKRPIQELEWD